MSLDDALKRIMEEPAPLAPEPRFLVLERRTEVCGTTYEPGTYYRYGSLRDFDPECPPSLEWICSPLYVGRVTCDPKGNNFSRLLRFLTLLGEWREWEMPMKLLEGNGSRLRRELLGMGVEISQRSIQNDLLLQYVRAWEEPR